MAKEQETIWDCPKCPKGKLVRRVSKTHGPFLGCSEYPKCKYTQSIEKDDSDGSGNWD